MLRAIAQQQRRTLFSSSRGMFMLHPCESFVLDVDYFCVVPLVSKQFVVIARDFDDAEALERRLAVREKHLNRILPKVDEGRVLLGGGILDSHEVVVVSSWIVKGDSILTL